MDERAGRADPAAPHGTGDGAALRRAVERLARGDQEQGCGGARMSVRRLPLAEQSNPDAWTIYIELQTERSPMSIPFKIPSTTVGATYSAYVRDGEDIAAAVAEAAMDAIDLDIEIEAGG